MKTYIYIDYNGLVIWCTFTDSALNRHNVLLRRYVIKSEYAGAFVRYYHLKLHPEALKNTVK
jgi:hypothetical protein